MGAFSELARLNPARPPEADLGPCPTTEAMRVAVLYSVLEEWVEAGACEELVVLGAGRHGERCPQLQEIGAVLHARRTSSPVHVTVIDIDSAVLEAVRSSAPYDFSLLSWRDFPEGDLKRRMEERLRALDRARPSSRFSLDVLRCDLTTMSFGEEIADAIVSTYALMYVLPKNEAGAIELLARVIRAVKPGGRFVIDSSAQVAGPLFFYDKAKLDDLARRLAELVGGPISIEGVARENPEIFVFRRAR